MSIKYKMVFAMCLGLLGSVCFAQQPANDNYANRILLSGKSVEFSGTLTGATLEPEFLFEDNPFVLMPPYWHGWGWYSYCQIETPRASVWWSWIASDNDPVTIEAMSWTDSCHHCDVEVREGEIPTNGTPRAVAMTRFDTGRRPFAIFQPMAGQSYNIRVAGTNEGNFVLRLVSTNSPAIVIQPVDQTVSEGGSMFFGVCASGIGPLSYQWRYNGSDLAGETRAILALDTVTRGQAGGYSVIVSNAAAGVESAVASLNVSVTDVHPVLTALGKTPEGQFAFRLSGEPGRCYGIESSSDLVNWAQETNFPGGAIKLTHVVFNTNATSTFSLPVGSSIKYLRATRYAPANELCNSHLKQIRFAREIWGMTGMYLDFQMPGWSELQPHLNFYWTDCPSGGSYCINWLGCDYECTVTNHVLEEPEF